MGMALLYFETIPIPTFPLKGKETSIESLLTQQPINPMIEAIWRKARDGIE